QLRREIGLVRDHLARLPLALADAAQGLVLDGLPGDGLGHRPRGCRGPTGLDETAPHEANTLATNTSHGRAAASNTSSPGSSTAASKRCRPCQTPPAPRRTSPLETSSVTPSARRRRSPSSGRRRRTWPQRPR